MIIRSSNREIEQELKALEKAIVDNGGWFHADLAIEYSDETGLTVHLDGSCPPSGYIIKVPDYLLIPVDAINMKVRDNEFAVDPDTSKLSPAQLEITRHMISVFNLTNKVEFHKNENPWIRFREAPELMQLLLRARTLEGYLEYKRSFMTGANDNILLEDFITKTFETSRVLGYEGYEDTPLRTCYMPVVDYMDHDYRGSIFLKVDNDTVGKGVHIQNRQPFVSSRQCYACYAMNDGLDMFLDYGFYDREIPVIRSVPLEIPVQDVGNIVVRSYLNRKNKTELAGQAGDLKKFMPSVNKTGGGNIELSHLFITVVQSPHVLRRILSMIIRSFAGTGMAQDIVNEQTRIAEEIVISENISFYKTLLNSLDEETDAPAGLVASIRLVAELQLSKLYKYYFDDAFYIKTGGLPGHNTAANETDT